MSDAASKPEQDRILPRLDVVVLNWNGRALLEDCLGSLEASDYPDLHILMVDNASDDESLGFCRERFPDVEILESPENLRWAGGNNLGLTHLLDRESTDHILLLNNDTIVSPGCLSTLVAATIQDPRAWAATPRICFADDPDRIWYNGGRVGSYTGWIRHEGIRKSIQGRSQRSRYCEYGTGCALLLTPAALQVASGFDTDYHLYGEDTDYSLRLRQAGGSILHVPSATILHKVSMSIGAASPTKAYLKSRSHTRLLRRFWTLWHRPILIMAQLPYLAAQVGWHIGQGHPATAVANLRGVIDELRNRPLRF